jgi:hypothetical protein
MNITAYLYFLALDQLERSHYHKLLTKPIRTNEMKFLIAALSITQAFAFSVIGANTRPISTQLHAAADYVPKEGEGKINLLVGSIYRMSSHLYR